jgi:predicted permease
MFAFLRTVLSRIGGLFGRARFDIEADDEVRTHLSLLTERFVRTGMSPEDARYAALRQFGGITPLKEELRERHMWPQLETTWQDIRYALRHLRKSPGFAVAAVLTLALGIGANSTVFTIINTAFLRPLPVEKPEQLVFLNQGGNANLSYPDYREFRNGTRELSGLAACRFAPVGLSVSNGNSRAWAYEATGNYFGVLGVQAYLGRMIGPEDDGQPGANPVAVLSYRTWQQRFAADPNVTGRSIKINGLGYTVIGVAPRGFFGTERILSPDLWVPMSMEAQIEPGNNWLDTRQTTNIWVIGRVEAGVSLAQTEASLNRIAEQLAHDYPSTNEGMNIRLSPPGLIGRTLRQPVMAFTTVLMGVAGLVLLLTCLNLAGLLLARASDRRREMALRLALGARRIRLVRQLLTESLLLALAGGTASVSLALWISHACASLNLPFDIPANTALAMDFRVLLFTFAAALIAVVLFGMAPALQTIRVDLVPALKNAPSTRRLRRWHLRDGVVTLQIALSFVLLVSSVLVLRSLRHAMDLELGFQPDGAVSVSFDLGLQGYSEARGRAFQDAVLQKAAALPGVLAVGSSNNVPLRLGTDEGNVSVAKPVSKVNESSHTMRYDVSPGYFAAAGTRLLAGRDINWRDRAGAPLVAVVNRTFARTLFPSENAIGRRFRFGIDPKAEAIEIVGIAEDGKYESLGEDQTLAVFQSLAQHYNAWTTLVMRTSLPAAEATDSLRRVIAEMDSSLPLFNTGSLRDQLAYPLFPARVAAVILGAFGFIAVVLAATGVFALVAYAVSRRTRGIGIRVALGASAGQVLNTVLGRIGMLVLVGGTAGAMISLVAGRGLAAVLYGVSPMDPETYAIVLVLMAAISIFSCWHPARRALRIDPSRSLREE